MATMFPEGITRFHTDGEGRVYRWLSQVAKPDPDFLIWYTPNVEEHEPDFLLYHDSVGIVVLEVKDWVLDQSFSPIAKPCTWSCAAGRRSAPIPCDKRRTTNTP